MLGLLTIMWFIYVVLLFSIYCSETYIVPFSIQFHSKRHYIVGYI